MAILAKADRKFRGRALAPKAAEDCRTPRPFGIPCGLRNRAASWSAAVLCPLSCLMEGGAMASRVAIFPGVATMRRISERLYGHKTIFVIRAAEEILWLY